MKKINVGGVVENCSAVGLGCMRHKELTKNEIENLVLGALDCGVNFFEHADIYGKGECEAMFGEFLTSHKGLRDSMIIQTKCGIRPNSFDFSKEHITNSVKNSLKKLNCDYLDILALHRPDILMEVDEVAMAFDELHQAGLVKNFGVSNQTRFQMELLKSEVKFPIVVNQLQFGPAHTMLIDCGILFNINDKNIDNSGTIEYCQLNNVTIQTWSPFNFGFFDGIFRTDERYKKLNSSLENIGEKYGVSGDAVVIAWILRHPAKMQVISGTTNLARLQSLASGADIQLTREEWYEIYLAAGNELP